MATLVTTNEIAFSAASFVITPCNVFVITNSPSFGSGVAVGVAVGVSVTFCDGVGVTSSSGVPVGVGSSVGVTSGVGSSTGVAVGSSVGVTSGVGSSVGVTSGVGSSVGVTSGVGSSVGVAVGFLVGVTSGVGSSVTFTVGVAVGLIVGVGEGNFWEIICHSPLVLTIVSHTNHPSPVVPILTKAFGAIIVACKLSEPISKLFTYGMFQIIVSAISSLDFFPSFTSTVYLGI